MSKSQVYFFTSTKFFVQSKKNIWTVGKISASRNKCHDEQTIFTRKYFKTDIVMPFIKGKYIFVSEIRIYNVPLLIIIAKLCHNLLHRWIIFRLYLGPQLLFKTEFIITHASGRNKKRFWEGPSQIIKNGASHPEFLLEPVNLFVSVGVVVRWSRNVGEHQTHQHLEFAYIKTRKLSKTLDFGRFLDARTPKRGGVLNLNTPDPFRYYQTMSWWTWACFL